MTNRDRRKDFCKDGEPINDHPLCCLLVRHSVQVWDQPCLVRLSRMCVFTDQKSPAERAALCFPAFRANKARRDPTNASRSRWKLSLSANFTAATNLILLNCFPPCLLWVCTNELAQRTDFVRKKRLICCFDRMSTCDSDGCVFLYLFIRYWLQWMFEIIWILFWFIFIDIN